MNSWTAIRPEVRARLRAYVFERDGYHCQIRGCNCKHREGCLGCAEELDHIVPRSAGGAKLDPSNCRAACQRCNRGRRPRKSNPLRPW